MLTLFTRPDCKPCARLKAWLDKWDILYEEADAGRPDAREVLRRQSGGQEVVVPTLMHGGSILVGWRGEERVRKWLEGLDV